MTKSNYSPPLDKLLKLGPVGGETEDSWPDYVKEFGLSQENVPELTRLATDYELRFSDEDDEDYEEDEEYADEDEEDVSWWGPVHGWRALGQLKAVAAAEELTKTFSWKDDDYPQMEMPLVFSRLGSSTIPILQNYLSDTTHELYPRALAIDCLEEMAEKHPEARDQAITALIKQLELYPQNSIELNAFLVSALENLKAENALPLIETAFKEEKVDFDITDWDSVQFKFGLISQEEYERREEKNNAARRGMRLEKMLGGKIPSGPPRGRAGSLNPFPSKKGEKDKVKAKRKMVKASRKKNRKHK